MCIVTQMFTVDSTSAPPRLRLAPFWAFAVFGAFGGVWGASIPRLRDLSWRFVAAAAFLPMIGLLFLRDRSELWVQTLGTIAVLVVVFSILQ